MEAGCFMAKTDVKSALRIIPIRPSDYSMLGMNGKILIWSIAVNRWAALLHVLFLKPIVPHLDCTWMARQALFWSFGSATYFRRPFVYCRLSREMSVRSPDDKLQKCRMSLHAFLKRRSVSLKELSQSLLSLLNFTRSVVVPGRAFLRRMIDLTRGTKRPHYY